MTEALESMLVDYKELLGMTVADIEYKYSPRDVAIYAFGVGLGMDRTSPQELGFVIEEDVKILPTFLYVAGYPGPWFQNEKLGMTWTHVLNWVQNYDVYALPGNHGHIRGVTKIAGAFNRENNKGAVIVTRREIFDVPTGKRLASVENYVIARANSVKDAPIYIGERIVTPTGGPDIECDLRTSDQIGLLYCLSGDRNAIHADPKMAQRAGFDTPILHGASTWGVAGHALLKSLCGYQPERLRQIRVHLSAPVLPGDTLRTRIWHTGSGQAYFQCYALERNVVVLDRGRVTYDA